MATEEREREVLRVISEITECRDEINRQHETASFGLREPRVGGHISKVRFASASDQRTMGRRLGATAARHPEIGPPFTRL